MKSFLAIARSLLLALVCTFHVFGQNEGSPGVYQGRHIAPVMGHQGAEWLERPERHAEERPDLLLQALKLKPGMNVADIGAGTGYFTWRMAKLVAPKGSVYAVEIQQEMLDMLATNVVAHGTTNFHSILGTVTDTHLPTNKIDLVLMVDVYHEFDHPLEMLESIWRSLSPNGRVVFVEYRGEDPNVPIKPLHKMTETQVRKEAELLPLQWVETIEILPRQHIIVFKKKATSPIQYNGSHARP
ncbi:MAG: class I SAM-dependent methyltransferase [Limisphaerales bacterium]